MNVCNNIEYLLKVAYVDMYGLKVPAEKNQKLNKIQMDITNYFQGTKCDQEIINLLKKF